MDTNVDFSVIEHLDFEVTEEPKDACEGFRIMNEKHAVTEEKECDRTPTIIAVRSCCGFVSKYCQECYNKICSFHAMMRAEGKVGTHSLDENTKHEVHGMPFSQVNFI